MSEQTWAKPKIREGIVCEDCSRPFHRHNLARCDCRVRSDDGALDVRIAATLSDLIEEIVRRDESHYGLHVHFGETGWTVNTIDQSSDLVGTPTLRAAVIALYEKLAPSDTRREREHGG